MGGRLTRCPPISSFSYSRRALLGGTVREMHEILRGRLD